MDRYKGEMEKLRGRRQELERMSLEIEQSAKQEESSRNCLDQMEAFCSRVAQRLDAMTFEERQQILRLLIERVTVEGDLVKVEAVIPTEPGNGQLRNARGELVER